jgi:uncharacterized RDD family membrane protein YckC/DNA-directed RNA polymerase subunit RPC12/RpoP
MPVKVKCDDCGKGFSVPDEARGKAVKCKGCGGRVRVPKGEGGRPRRKKAARPRKSVTDDDFFSSLDLDRAEDQNVQVCPKCAAEVDEEDIECPGCGVNLETGVLSEKQKRKRTSKGPDPDEFFKIAWSNPWEFTKNNWSLAIRISVAWSLFSAILLSAVFLTNHYFAYVPDLENDDQRPWPLIGFWSLLSVIALCATTGVFWHTFIETIVATVDRKDELKRFNLDFFSSVALGLKLFFWPIVVISPVALPVLITAVALWFTGVYTCDDALFVWLIVGGCLYVSPLIFFPLAISHLTAKYTFKAYTLVYMTRILIANIKPVMMFWLIAFCVMLPAAGAAGGCAAGGQQIYTAFTDLVVKILGFMVDTGTTGHLEQGRFLGFRALLPLVSMPLMFVSLFVVSVLLSFPGIYLMRLAGLFRYYNKRSLDMGDKRQGDQPADFWVRYLQLLVDCFVVLLMATAIAGIVFGLCLFGQYLTTDEKEVPVIEQLGPLTWQLMGVVAFLVPLAYFVLAESGPGKGTLGMQGVGIYIIDQFGNSPISKGAAITRFFIRLLTLGLSGLAMLGDKHKRALHDQSSQTHVVWKREVY